MDIEYRSPTKEEWPGFGQAVSRGFGSHPPTDQQSRDSWDGFRSTATVVGAFEGEEIVGTSGYPVADTTVPGGTNLPAALVTIVTVAATHRRRGILTNMMSRLLHEAHEADLPMATLWASESIIYGRFGYGMAGQHYASKIRSEKANLLHSPETRGAVKYANRERVREVGPGIWNRAASSRPGMPGRSDNKWQWDHPLPEDSSKPEKQRFYAVYEENGRPEGYISYSATDLGEEYGRSDLRIGDMIGTSDAAIAALWKFVLNIDLVRTVRYDTMPLDDPLWWMLSDPRHLERRPYDAIWMRLLDVERCLSARTYSQPVNIVFDVEDEFCPWVAGRYRLIANSDGHAECVRTNDAADIALPAASLAACYFGSVKLSNLARASRVQELTPGTMRLADSAFAAEREPWCPLHY